MVFAGGIFGSPGGAGGSGMTGMTGPQGPQGDPGPSGASGLPGVDGLLTEPVDAREASGSIIPDTSGIYDLGSNTQRWRNLFATSGTFGSNSVNIQDCISITNPNAEIGLTINQDGNADALRINKGAVGGDCVQVDNAGTGRGILLTQTGTQTAMHIIQSTARRALLIQKSSTGSAEALQVENAGTSPCLLLSQTGTGTALDITQTGNGEAVEIRQTSNQQGVIIDKSANGAGEALVVENAGTDAGIDLTCLRSLFSDTALNIKVSGVTPEDFDFCKYSNLSGIQFRVRGDGTLFAASGVFGSDTTIITDKSVITESGLFGGVTLITGDEIVAGFSGQVKTSLVTCQNVSSTVPGSVFSALNGIASDAGYAGTLLGLQTAQESPASTWNYIQGIADTDGSPDAGFRARGDGALFSDIAASTPADYAEYFETANPSGIEAGFAVKLNLDGLLEIATSGEILAGIVSAAPAVIADAAWSSWHDKWLKTEFGAYQLDENGERTLNPAWDSELEYQSREERPEWVTVGLLGKIWVRTYGEHLLPGDFATLGLSGMLTKATTQEPHWLVVASGVPFDPTTGYGTTRILYK
jgi:trimeric autotransporter adhesin